MLEILQADPILFRNLVFKNDSLFSVQFWLVQSDQMHVFNHMFISFYSDLSGSLSDVSFVGLVVSCSDRFFRTSKC